MISTALWFFNNFLSLKTDLNVGVPKRKNFLKRNFFFVGIMKATKKRAGSVIQWLESINPDPYQNVTDQEHWFKGKAAKTVTNNVLQLIPHTLWVSWDCWTACMCRILADCRWRGRVRWWAEWRPRASSQPSGSESCPPLAGAWEMYSRWRTRRYCWWQGRGRGWPGEGRWPQPASSRGAATQREGSRPGTRPSLLAHQCWWKIKNCGLGYSDYDVFLNDEVHGNISVKSNLKTL